LFAKRDPALAISFCLTVIDTIVKLSASKPDWEINVGQFNEVGLRNDGMDKT